MKMLYFRVYISLQKNAFWAFFPELQNENGFFKQLFSSSLNRLLRKTDCFKKPFSILQFTKKAQKAIFWSEMH